MKLKSIICWSAIFMIFATAQDLEAQSFWTRTYGGASGDNASSVIQTSDAGFLIAGTTNSFGAGSNDIWLVKLDSHGDTLWTHTYGGTDADRASSVIQTSDNGFLIVGDTRSFGAGNRDFWVVKTNSKGDTLWTHTYGGMEYDVARSAVEISGEGYILAGETTSFGVGFFDIYLVKINYFGDTLWTHTYGGSGEERASSIISTSDECLLVGGYTTHVFLGDSDFWLIKMNSQGDTLWTRSYGGTKDEYAISIIPTSDEGFLAAGYTQTLGFSNLDFWLVKTDSQGDTLWTSTYGGPRMEIARSVIQTSDEGFLIVGETDSFSPAPGYFPDPWLVKINAQGDTLWTQTYGGRRSDKAYSVVQTFDQGFVFAGYTTSYGAGSTDYWVVKTDYQGNTDQTLLPLRDAPPQIIYHHMDIYPNPLNNSCVVKYTIPEVEVVSITVYDVRGVIVWASDFPLQQVGSHAYVWNAKLHDGSDLPSGVYIFRISTPSWQSTQKAILLK